MHITSQWFKHIQSDRGEYAKLCVLAGEPINVANSRYADDVILASNHLCESCIYKKIRQIYGKETFSEQCRTPQYIDWLDMRIIPAKLVKDFKIVPVCSTEGSKRTSIHPYLDSRSPHKKDIKALASCFAARWAQLKLTREQLQQAVDTEIKFWQKHWYPDRVTC